MSVRQRWLAAVAAAALALVMAAPAGAITFGQLDGSKHPWVGSMVVIIDGNNESFCSGTLISPTVFLTAAHCTAALATMGFAPDEVFVTFDPKVDNGSALIGGTYHTDPAYNSYAGPGGRSDPHDIAVIVLDAPAAGITPAQLPTAGYLDSLSLRSEWFTAVGYGTVREDKTKGFQSLFWDPQRRYATQTAMNLIPHWLDLSMNPSTGDGGTCYGDSGGPHFLRDTNLVVAITVTGDAPCRATDVTYRMDTASARSFLDQFVSLP